MFVAISDSLNFNYSATLLPIKVAIINVKNNQTESLGINNFFIVLKEKNFERKF